MGTRGRYPAAYVAGPYGLWEIKFESWYKPNPRGFGLRVGGPGEAKRVLVDGVPSWGLRPIPAELLGKLVVARSERAVASLVGRVLRNPPLAPEEIATPILLQGPFLSASKPLGQISRVQARLEARLDAELERLVAGYGYIG